MTDLMAGFLSVRPDFSDNLLPGPLLSVYVLY